MSAISFHEPFHSRFRMAVVRDLRSRLHYSCSALSLRVPAPGDLNSSSTPLLSRVGKGCTRSMEECIASYSGLVWSLILSRVKNSGDAEDLAQEIFTEIWKIADRYDPAVASESTFIAMITRRRTIDWLRKQQRLPEMETLANSPDHPAPEIFPDTGTDREMLWQAVGDLPQETRRLFTLHFEQGMTHLEISEETGLPLGSVKTAMRRGLIEVRRLLKHRDPDASTEKEVAR